MQGFCAGDFSNAFSLWSMALGSLLSDARILRFQCQVNAFAPFCRDPRNVANEDFNHHSNQGNNKIAIWAVSKNRRHANVSIVITLSPGTFNDWVVTSKRSAPLPENQRLAG
jgi:hypothetical protein